jgi:hypothetical protein
MDLIHISKELNNFRKTDVPYDSKSSACSNGSVRFGENHQSAHSI